MDKRVWVGTLGLVLCLACDDGTVTDELDAGNADGSPGDGTGDGSPGDGSDGTPADGTPADGTPADGDPGDGDGGQDGSPGDGDGDGAPDGQVSGIVAVGYGGLTVVSRDHGVSWGDAALLTTMLSEIEADNEYLLRGIAWGEGLWIATGWKILLSSDGVVWDEVPSIAGCNVIESVAYGNDTFVGACGETAYLTSDGMDWENGGQMGSLGGHPKLRFAEEKFVVTGDNGNSFTSTDGKSWSALSGVSYARVCDGQIVSRDECPEEQPPINDTEGIWVEDDAWFISQWGGHILHSTDGVSYSSVYTNDHSASPYNFAAGFVAP